MNNREAVQFVENGWKVLGKSYRHRLGSYACETTTWRDYLPDIVISF
jgi:hypothetical protein